MKTDMLPNDLKISSLKEGANYKYLGILEAEDIIISKKMRGKVKAEYLRSTRNILKSELNSENLFKAINTWVVSLFCFSAAFIDWSKEISEVYRRTGKLLTMHKEHYPKDDVHKLYLKIKEGCRGLSSAEEFAIEGAIAGLHCNVQNSEERLITAAWRSSGEQEVIEPPKITKQRWQTKRKRDWKNKKFHG